MRRRIEPTTRVGVERRLVASLESHNTDLFDLNEGPGGERADLATGKPIDNSKSPVLLSRREAGEMEGSLDEIEDTDKEGEKWLRENGGQNAAMEEGDRSGREENAETPFMASRGAQTPQSPRTILRRKTPPAHPKENHPQN